MAVAVTIVSQSRAQDGSGKRKRVVADVAYTAEAYAAGVPLDRNLLGMPNSLESLKFVDDDNASSDIVKYDSSNERIRVWEEDTGGDSEFDEYAAANLTATYRVEAIGW